MSPYFTIRLWDLRCFCLFMWDDILLIGSDSKLVSELMQRLASMFKLRDLGSPSFFLGIETIPFENGMILSQRRYMSDILNSARMIGCKPLASPILVARSVSLSEELYDNPTHYMSLISRCVVVSHSYTLRSVLCSESALSAYAFFDCSTLDYAKACVEVCQGLKGTLNFGLRLCASNSFDLHAYSDSDWAGSTVDRKSTSGFAVFLGRNLVPWVSRKQRTFAQSSTKAEYKGLADVAAEVTLDCFLIAELGLHSSNPPRL
ncbi:PREDICTED: uncharacterized protein LOC109151197 [Ipomoea nil]|uniref:uncharacterized protein LOC109151197 n=1 Tax=Ipomoea nil TaxID=35883 RepID=UPI000900F6C4|nr:PREDICTED: uncharacterized protein LOC109151197 [Ipomoea nil]